MYVGQNVKASDKDLVETRNFKFRLHGVSIPECRNHQSDSGHVGVVQALEMNKERANQNSNDGHQASQESNAPQSLKQHQHWKLFSPLL